MSRSLIVAALFIGTLIYVNLNCIAAGSSFELPAKYVKLNEWMAKNEIETSGRLADAKAAITFIKTNEANLNQDEIDAAYLFAELSKIKADPCSESSVAILDRLIDDINVSRSPFVERHSRLNDIIFDYAKIHSSVCAEVYKNTYLVLDEEFKFLDHIFLSGFASVAARNFGISDDDSDLKFEFGNEGWNQFLEELGAKSPNSRIAKIVRATWLTMGDMNAQKYFNVGRNELTGENFVDKAKLSFLVRKTFRDCSSFLEHFGNFLNNLELDAEVSGLKEYAYPEIANAWAIGEICERFLERDRDIIIKDVIMQIESEISIYDRNL